MNRFVSHVSWSKLAALGLILSACALGGCGRKGPLDLPPGATLSPATAEGTSENYRSQSSSGSAADESLFAPAGSQSRQMVAPRGAKKRIILDPILD